MVRGGAPRARPADDPDDRAPLLRAAAGRRPAALPAAAAEPLRRRGAAHRARVAVRRRLERRPRPHPRRLPSAGRSSRASSARCPTISRRTTGASSARSCSATSASSRARRGSRWSCSASASSSSTTTTSPCWRDATASAAMRTCASSRGSRGRTRSSAARTSRGSSGSSPSRRPPAHRERDAVSEEEGADAVRLLTIHAAKGLEFKVVVVADAGRERARTDEILCLSDGRFGFKVAHPGTGSRVSTTSYQAVKETRDLAEEAERLRLYYVAMTRAMERLIVSGSVDRSSERDERTPIGWVLERLDPRGGARPGGGVGAGRGRAGQRRHRAAGRSLRPRGRRRASARAEAESAADEAGQLVLFEGAGEEIPAAAPRLRELVEIPAPPLARVARLSYSAIALHDRCGYRYYAERIVGMQPAPWEPRWRRRHGVGGGLHPDRDRRCRPPAARARRPRRARRRPRPTSSRALVRGWYPAVTADEVRADRRARDGRTPAPRSRLGSRRCRAPGRSGRSRSSSTACSSTDGSTCSGSKASAPSCSTTRRTRCSDVTRRRSSRQEYSTQQVVYAVACLRAGRPRGRGRLPLPRGGGRGRLEGLHACGCRAARGAPLRLDRADQERGVPADAEPVRLLGLPGARRRLRRPAARRWARRRRSRRSPPRSSGARGRTQLRGEARRRGLGTRRERIGPIVERLARGARRRGDRAPLRERCRAAHLRDALGPDDRRERQPGHREAVRQVPAARGLPRRAPGGARAGHLPDRLLPAEGEVDPRRDARC